MSEARPEWPARAAQGQGTGSPRLAEAWGRLGYAPALREASGAPAGRSLSHPVSDLGATATVADWSELSEARLRELVAR